MATFPLQLDRYFFTEIQVEANIDFSPQGAKRLHIEPAVEVAFSDFEENAKNFGLMLNLTIANTDDKAQPYNVKLCLVGMFSVAESVPEDERSKLVVRNGASILYGAARDFVASLTARGPYPEIYLAPMSFSNYGPTGKVIERPLFSSTAKTEASPTRRHRARKKTAAAKRR